MSFGQWLHDELIKGKALALKILDEVDQADVAIDAAAPTVEAVTKIAYPPAVIIEEGFVAVMDAVAALVKSQTAKAADGSMSLTLTPDVVQKVEAVIATGDAAYQAIKKP